MPTPPTQAPLTQALSNEGVSIWLDDLSRHALTTGGLSELIGTRNVVGVTTNPTIFAAALSRGTDYHDQVVTLSRSDLDLDQVALELITTDVADACDVFVDLYASTGGRDGRVSIEVDPRLAYETDATIAQARQLAAKVGRNNVMIKIPATDQGLAAITEVLGDGISVNVTLIFGLDRYRQVIDAYLTGLEKAQAAGIDLATIQSVASFFVSRVDTEIDKRLAALTAPAAQDLKGRAGVANARLAYQVWEQEFAAPRAAALLAAGGNPQRPLWASTGVKDPNLPDTYYVQELVAPNVVNTMPAATLAATADHAALAGDTITGGYADAQAVLDAVQGHGISYADVIATLEKEGVVKFIDSWNQLLGIVETVLTDARNERT